MAIDTVRIKDLEEVSVNDLDQLWMVVDSGTPDSTNKVKLSALAGYIGGQADGRYIPLAGSSDITGSLIPKADKAIALGSGSFRWSALHAGEVHAADVLSIPSSAPSDPVSGNVYLYASSLGEYSGTPGGGGGSATIYDLIYQKNGTTVSTINLGTAQGTINVTISRSDVEDSTHKLATTDQISAWNAKLDSVPLATSSVIGGFKYGDPEDTLLVMNDGYLAVDLQKYVAATQTIIEGYGYTQKTQAIPYIVGPSTDATAGTWTGTYDGITAYSEGLTIIYVPNVAGASTTKLNINGLGAVTCYYSGTSKMTTHYPVGTPILLTYRTISGTAGWRRADYDSNTNTYIRIYRQTSGYDDDYPIIVSRTKTIGTAGENASYTAVYGVVHDTTQQPTVNPATGVVKAKTFRGELSWNYITDKPALGTAAALDSVTSITSGGANLPTAGTVYTYVNNAITSAQPYKGVSSTAITDGGTEMPTISGYTTRTKGDVVAYNNKEFIWEGDKWRELGDEGSYALKTVQVIAGTGLSGGGQISQDVTLSLSSATQTSLGKADTAVQPGDHKALTLKVGTSTVQADYNALAAKTYTISKQNLTDTIGSTTYAAYNADGYLPLSAGSGKALTGTLYGTSAIFSGDITAGGAVQVDGTIHADGNISSDLNVLAYGVKASDILAIPTSAPAAAAIVSGEVYLYASSLGSYSETPGGGGGSATIYDLIYQKNGTTVSTINLGTAQGTINVTISRSDVEDSTHKLATTDQIANWNTAYGWGDHAQAGYLTSVAFGDLTAHPTTLSGYGITDAKIANGTITLGNSSITPLTSFTETDPTVPSWAKASSKPAYSLTEITGTDDLQAIEALSGTSGFLTKTAANTWSLDTTTYVPTSRKVNNKALSADITLSLDDVADGSTRKLADYLPLSGGTMENTNLVTKLNANYLQGYGRAAYIPAVAYSGVGYLVTTDLAITSSYMVYVRIEGNSYSTSNVPVYTTLQWYSRSSDTSVLRATGARYGSGPETFKIKYINGKICLWFAKTGDTQSYYVTVWQGNVTNNTTRGTNRVTSIETQAEPTDDTVTYTATITPSKVAWASQLPTSLDDIPDGSTRKLADYLPLTGGTLTGALTGTSATFTSGSIADLAVSAKLAIPTSAPSTTTSGNVYLYASSLGEYSATPSGGGGGGDIYPLTITKNGSAWLSYNPSSAAASVNLTVPTSINDLDLILDGSTEAKYIYGHGSSGDDYVVIGMSNNGNIVIGSSAFQSDQYKSYIYAYEHNIYWGTGTNKRLYFTSGGVIRPTTNNVIELGSSSYKYKSAWINRVNADVALSIPKTLTTTYDTGKVYMYYDETNHQLCVRETSGTVYKVTLTT